MSVYVDDVLVFSSSFQDHVEHVSQVFNALQNAGLKLKPSKCRLFRKEVEYLGYLLTPDGLLPTVSQTEAVANFPVPTSLHEVRQFIGLVSYYRRFIEGFATIAQPPHLLTRKGVKFVWNPDCQNAFQSLKDKLVSHPVLRYPNLTKISSWRQMPVLETWSCPQSRTGRWKATSCCLCQPSCFSV